MVFSEYMNFINNCDILQTFSLDRFFHFLLTEIFIAPFKVDFGAGICRIWKRTTTVDD